MNNIIPFKKDIIFKTKIADITDISLTHDYKVLDDMTEGQFFLSGTYKITEASVVNEEFYYNIPFSIALSDRIKKESINLVIDDFKYSFKDDVLSFNVDLNMFYDEEKEEETSIEDVIEDIRKIEEDIIPLPQDDIKEEIVETEEVKTIINPVESEINKDVTIKNLLNDINTINEYTTYKVHIVRSDDTFESIASKYNVSLDNIKEYNKVDSLNIGDKILVPFIYNE